MQHDEDWRQRFGERVTEPLACPSTCTVSRFSQTGVLFWPAQHLVVMAYGSLGRLCTGLLRQGARGQKTDAAVPDFNAHKSYFWGNLA